VLRDNQPGRRGDARLAGRPPGAARRKDFDMIGNQHRVVVATLALAAGSLAACGSSSSNNGTPTPTPTPTVSRLWVVSDGQTAVTAPQRTDYTAGKLYANAHTNANPAGDIRGQLDQDGTIKMAVLTGAQEAPSAVTTDGFGAGALSVDETTRAARGFVLTSGLQNVTVAHIHQSSGRGVAGGVIVPLVGGPDVWVVPDGTTLTADQVTAFNAGQLYFNVHTQANQNGEIRGQIDHSGTVRLGSLNGAQETPPVTTNAYGGCMVAVDEVSGAVAGFTISSGLSGTLAHIHQQIRGQAGGVIVPMTGGPTLWVVADAQAPISAGEITAFQQGSLYCNEHTTAHGAGEIRGQLDKSGDVRMAAMNAAQEIPPTGSTATGAAVVSVDSGSGDVRGFFAVTGIVDPTIAHIHDSAGRTASGGVIVPLGP
jgi:CHRD domain-containing protein